MDGVTGVAQSRIGTPQAPQVGRLPPPVGDLVVDGEGLLVEFDGATGLAEGDVGTPEVPQVGRLPPAEADLAVDGEGLLVEFDRATGLAERGIGTPRSRLTASPCRSPLSREMASACSWSSIARRVSPRAA